MTSLNEHQATLRLANVSSATLRYDWSNTFLPGSKPAKSIITGGATGIGLAIASAFSEQRLPLVLLDVERAAT
jgi:hypothetical protein